VITLRPSSNLTREPVRMAKFIAGGTNLIDLMKEDVERPSPPAAEPSPVAVQRAAVRTVHDHSTTASRRSR
jgi:hypothetical protein